MRIKKGAGKKSDKNMSDNTVRGGKKARSGVSNRANMSHSAVTSNRASTSSRAGTSTRAATSNRTNKNTANRAVANSSRLTANSANRAGSKINNSKQQKYIYDTSGKSAESKNANSRRQRKIDKKNQKEAYKKYKAEQKRIKKQNKKPLKIRIAENKVNLTWLLVAVIIGCAFVFPGAVNLIKTQTALNKAQAELAYEQQQQEENDKELALWNDKNYVVAKAREKLSFVMPGETIYRVTDSDADTDSSSGKSDSKNKQLTETWYQRTLDSINMSDSMKSSKK